MFGEGEEWGGDLVKRKVLVFFHAMDGWRNCTKQRQQHAKPIKNVTKVSRMAIKAHVYYIALTLLLCLSLTYTLTFS